MNIIVNILTGTEMYSNKYPSTEWEIFTKDIQKVCQDPLIKGLIFVNQDGKVLQTQPPYSDVKIESICKVITGYYNE